MQRMNNVISIHYGHNATVALSMDGEVKCVISEERLNRIKNAVGFPFKAFEYVVNTYLDGDKNQISKVVLNDKELVGVQSLECWGYEPHRNTDYFCYTSKKGFLRRYGHQKLSKKIKHFFKKRKSPFPFTNTPEELLSKIAQKIGVVSEKIELLDHHTAHILAAMMFIDETKDYLCFSLDGEGDSSCAKVGVMKQGELKILSDNHLNNSLGLLYMYVTGYLGMKPNEHEFKVMGMAPYAKLEQVSRVKKIFEDYMWLDENGQFKCKGNVHHCLDYLVEHLLFERFDNICGAIQLFTEELMVKWVKYWIKKTSMADIVVGGGVMMNVKAVKRLYEIEDVSSIFVVPSSGDESLVLGGLYKGNKSINQSCQKITHLYLGTQNKDEDIEAYLNTVSDRYSYEKLAPDAMAQKVAQLLADNEVVARCCGKDEWGARALGNRSILCNAAHFKNLDILNQYIKDRDFWMPFTPSILAEDIDLYIENPRKMSVPYMCITFNSTDLARTKIPAALHPHDYTVRPQAVYKAWNPEYHAILTAFKKLTGISGVLNTSFNLHGEPNVCNYKDAIHTLDNSMLKYVILESYLVTKKG